MCRNSTRVYSTHPDANKDEHAVKETHIPVNRQTAYVARDRKRRKGKTVTVISRLQGDLTQLKKDLQKHCGAGGSVKNGEIEIQGDHREKIAAFLLDKGYKVKLMQ